MSGGAGHAALRLSVTNRYTIFLGVVVLSALSPALPHKTTPDGAWWAASAGVIVVMVAVGWLGIRRGPDNWLNTLAPLLLFPAIWTLRCADGNSTSGFTPLIFLPVIWFALFGRLRDVVLAVVGGALTVFLPMLVIGPPQYPTTSWRGSLLLVIITAAAGLLVYRLVDTTTRSNRALARSESEFRATFEDAPVGMAITGLRGDEAFRFVRVNNALCEIFGRTAAELTSAPVTAFTHPDDVALTNYRFDVITDPSVPHQIEKRYLHKSGRAIWALVSFSVVLDEHGEPAHLISQIEDLGTRRDSDQALLDAYETDRVANERLARLERMRAEMASTVSHELRTPLTSAAGYVELLSEGDAGPLTEEQRTMLDTVARSLSRLDGIVDDVLSMANSQGAGAREAASIADIGDVVESALASVALQAATRGQDLVADIDLDGVSVQADAGRLERLVVNLLTNALKFTPDDGTITVSATHDDADVRIAIADTGIGIATEDQQRIFERFYRVERGMEVTASGTGLGLSIVQAIAQQYGGTIAVDSELGKGSTFTVTIPLNHHIDA